jgi:hypothetical protein
MRKITGSLMALFETPLADARKFIGWIHKTRNNLDQKVLTYPRTCMARAEREGETVMMIPVNPVLMFESVAADPSLSERERALCLWKIGEIVEQAMKDSGHCEAYFLTRDDRLAETVSRHGWTEQKGYRILKRQIDPPLPVSISEDKDACNDTA